MADYTRPGRFDFMARGIDVNTPVDRLRDQGKYPILRNVIVGTDGTLEPRPGLTNRYASYVSITAKSPVHSYKRINDTSTGSLVSTLLQGVGDIVAYEQSGAVGTLAVADSGPYSTNPLSLTLYRPPRAVQPWAYIADSSRMRKIRYDTPTAAIQVHRIGLPAPTFEPVCAPSTGTFKTIDLFEPAGGGTGYTRWTAAAGGVITGAVAGLRVNTGASNVLFEAYTGADQICLVQPASMAGINVGCILFANFTTEDILVTQVNKPSSTLTISRIIYDSGTTGLCSLALSNSPRELTVNSMLWNSTVGEYVRVRSVNLGPDGIASYRVSTFNTWAATNSVAGVGSFVCHPGLNPAGATLTSNAMSVTAPGGTAPATFSQTIALDLTQLTGTSIAQPTTLDDWITIAIRIDFPDLVDELKLFFDFDSATNDFTRNYYYHALSPSDLIPVTTGTQSALDNRRTQVSRKVIERSRFRSPFQREIEDEARDREPDNADVTDSGGGEDPPRTQLGAGTSQWSQIRFRLRDLQRIGTDESRGLRNIAAIRVSVLCHGAIIMDVDAWVMHGGFAPDVEEPAQGYQYAYRARVSSTGTVSDLSPLSRGPANAVRQRVSVVLSQYTTASEVDYLDVFRIGGNLSDVAYVGSVANAASPVFLDTYSDIAVDARANANGTFDIEDPDLALWPDLDLPRSGTATVVAGTTIQSNAQFPADLAPGTLITVDGIPTLLYRQISTSKLEVLDCLGSKANVAWTIADPIIINQNFSIICGPYHEHLLACGSTRNPGSLYFTKAQNVDSTSRRRRLEITSPSDRLQNIFIFNGRAGVFATLGLYYLEYNPIDPYYVFSAEHSPGVQGLYSRWAMATSKRRGVAWLANDGVYLMDGGGAKNLTDKDLRPLFPFGGKQGADTNGISAPYMPNPVGAEEKFLRLAFDENDNLRFIYRDSSGNLRCLLYDFSLEGWMPFIYQKPVTIFYSEEGPGVRNLIAGTSEATGRTLTVGGPSDTYTDDGTGFPCQVRTPSMDFGDPRSQKQIGDIEVDINPGNASITVQAGFDNFVTTVGAITLTGAARINPPSIYDLSSGSGQFARNVALDLSWTNGSTQHPILHLWEPSYLSHPEDTQVRASDYEFVSSGLVYVRGLWVSANTSSVNRTIVLDYIGHLGTSQTYPITVNHPVKSRIYYPITPTPFYTSTLRARPNDAGKWKFYGIELDADPAPPFSTEPTPFTDDGDPTAKFLQGCKIKLDTHSTSVSYQVQGDAGALLTTTPVLSCALPSVIAVPFIPAVRTHLVRLVPLQPVHTFSVEWDWQSEPELVNYYEGQETSLDLPGFKHIREIYIAYAFASSPLTLLLYMDGSAVPLANVPSLPASTAYVRRRILIPAKKFKAIKPVLSSTANFRPYSRDCSVYYKGWGEDGDYRVMELFGTQHRDRGIARI